MEKLTKKSLNDFIQWTTTKYNDYMGYGTKKENVESVYRSLVNGFFVSVWFRKDGTPVENNHPEKTIFDIQCASPVGESGSGRKSSYWKTKQGGGYYTVDCIAKTITEKYSGRTINFKTP